MDLFVLVTIVIVFLVLLAASLLVNKMPSGKTFEQVQAEKKQLADQMKQQSRPAKQKGGGGGGNAAKGAGKGRKGKKQQQEAEEEQQQEVIAEPHVEFVEEQIYLSDDLPVVKKPLSSTGVNKQQANAKKTENNKKSKSGKTAGILVNKHEGQATAVAPAAIPPVEANHFEDIQPKDDVEMLKAHRDEPTKGGKPHKNAVNELRKEKKAKNNNNKQPSQPTKTSSSNILVPSDVADIEGVEQILKANEQKLQKRNVDAVDSVRNKRATRTDNSLQALQKMVEGTDEISVNVLIMLLAKAELSRSEIQVVIDYLLNKQSDSGAVIKSEWTEGKQDLVARLKKQLAERETQVQNEQEAAVAFQEKLKLLRLELNAERTQNANTAKMYIVEMAQKEKEMEVLASKVNVAGTEKAALLAQMQKMQVTLVQQKNAMGAQEDHQRQLQQLQEANAAMQRELEMYKNTVQVGKVDLRNLENELDSARNEIIQLHQKSFEVSEQMNRDAVVLSGQVAALQSEVANYESKCAEKQAAVEQYEAEKRALIEQYETEKGQSKGAEDTLFRQLSEQKQSATSLQAEVAKYESLLAEKKAVIDKYEAEQGQTKGAEESLQRQLEEQKQKNNDLRTTNWMLMEAVTAAEKAAASSNDVHNENKNKKDLEVLMREKAEDAEKELRDKFTHMLTQISVFSNLKLDNGSSAQSSNSNGDSKSGSSNGTAELDAWMSRVTDGLKKKLDVYESLLGTLRQQLREKELMAVASAKSNSAKFLSEAANGGGGGGAAAEKKNGKGAEGESNGNGTGVVAST